MMMALLRIVGIVHLIILGANFVLPRILDFDKNLEKASPIVRQIFHVHHAYIMLILAFFAFVCLAFTNDLAGASPLGTALCSFMAIFWLARLPIQFFFYDEQVRRENRFAHYAFSFALASIAAVLSAAAIRGLL